MTIVNKMDVDHGLTVPLTLMFGQPQEWPVQDHPAAGERHSVSAADGQPLLQSRQGDQARRRVLPGGSARRRSSARAACRTSCRASARVSSTRSGTSASSTACATTPQVAAQDSVHRVRARGRLRGHRDGHVADHRAARSSEKVREVYRFYHVPASNTALGHLILENERCQEHDHEDRASRGRAPSASSTSRRCRRFRRRGRLARGRQRRSRPRRWRRNSAFRTGPRISPRAWRSPASRRRSSPRPTQMHAEQADAVHARRQARADRDSDRGQPRGRRAAVAGAEGDRPHRHGRPHAPLQSRAISGSTSASRPAS